MRHAARWLCPLWAALLLWLTPMLASESLGAGGALSTSFSRGYCLLLAGLLLGSLCGGWLGVRCGYVAASSRVRCLRMVLAGTAVLLVSYLVCVGLLLMGALALWGAGGVRAMWRLIPLQVTLASFGSVPRDALLALAGFLVRLLDVWLPSQGLPEDDGSASETPGGEAPGNESRLAKGSPEKASLKSRVLPSLSCVLIAAWAALRLPAWVSVVPAFTPAMHYGTNALAQHGFSSPSPWAAVPLISSLALLALSRGFLCPRPVRKGGSCEEVPWWSFALPDALLCLGELGARFFLRTMPGASPLLVRASAAALVAQTAVLLTMALVVLAFSRKPEPDDDGSPARAPERNATARGRHDAVGPLRSRLCALGLSVRESEVVGLLSDGLTSAQVAQQLGIGASTVRNLKKRALNKTEAANLDELLSRAGACDGALETSRQSSDDRRCPGGGATLRAALRLVGCAALAALLLPWGVDPGASWYVYPRVCVSCAFGCFAWACGRAVRRLWGRKATEASSLSVSPADFFLSGALVLLCLLRPGLWEASEDAIAPLACCLVLVVGVISALSELEHVTGLAGGGILGPARVGGMGDGDDQRAKPYVAALVLLSSGTTLVWMEAWRASSWPYETSVTAFAPFVLSCLLVPLVSGPLLDRPRMRWATASLVALLGVALLACGAMGLLVMLMIAVWMGCHVLRPDARTLPLSAAVSGAAWLIGPFLVCAIGDFSMGLALTSPLRSLPLLHGAIAYAGGAVAVLAALVVAITCWRVQHLAPACDEPVGLAPEGRDRIHHYLLGRGLSELQANVLLGVMAGQPDRQIATELNYASSTVAAARRAAFARLGVRDRSQLIASVFAATGCRRTEG